MEIGRPVQIVTISREYGSGGSDIAAILGKWLGWRVVDTALIVEVAKRLGAPEAEVAGLDEYVGGVLERIGSIFAHGVPESVLTPSIPDPDAIAKVGWAVMKDAAQSPPVILVGHGAQCLFGGRSDTLKVRVGAPFHVRVRRVAARMEVSEADAETETRRRDVERRRYLHYHFHCEWTDPALYDLQLNTGGIEYEEAAGLIRQLIDARVPLQA